MSNAPTWKATQTALAEQKEREFQDNLLLSLADARFKEIRGETPPPEPPPAPAQQHVPVDVETDCAEFAELLAVIAAEKDEGTVVTAMSLEDFRHGLEEPPLPVHPQPATSEESSQ